MFDYNPPELAPDDAGYRAQQLRKDLHAKRAAMPRVDHNGRPLPLARQTPEYRALIAANEAKREGR